ncbi:hypothetical protein IX317_002157 [Fusobacterium sp. DD29]|uniref:alkaline shock response membrane anchor protein AmaP n=1 Tax=unclassified Fusobacterium TaxID=2648384 RepID=UPI001B8B6B41|nr:MULTISPECIES: alkaline shock response membrane anchor protein AmaP [unclassified Fusobacterium]MBR8702161.1 hypothetical protein [Fusobacterium sp. DD45]MBR8711984.1 hypothetical protein [Fusobacterium sp. DD28]MBR8750435.1 hypothetical protein [Fusobacterium sp. DD29]MBR8752557.1 hypothetical protein [Fusobacterium sp. DD26]MBR8762678.1 hypothetical protein [Fusobacterium sp. DD25]
MFKKFIFFLAWIGVFVLSLTGIVYVVMPKYFVQFNTYIGTFGYDMVVLGISIIYFIICLVKFFSLFEREKDYVIKTEDGVVYISAATVTTFIRDLLSDDKDISNLKVDTFKKGRKFNIKIKLDILSNGDVSGKSMSIQNEIKNKLADKMGIEVGNVQVKISKLALRDSDPEEK